MAKELSKEDLYRPGMQGIPACRSKVGFIDGQKGILQYRAIPIEDLATQSIFEETSFLLLYGHLPSSEELNTFSWKLREQRKLKFKVIDIIHCLPEDGHPMAALQTAVSALGMFYPLENMQNQEKNYEAAIRLIAKVPTIIATYHRFRSGHNPIPPDENLSYAANFLYMLTGKKPSKNEERVFDACLILHAEHTLNASTFSARVTGSTLASPFSLVATAIGTLSGPLHGGANERVIEMLRQIGSIEQVRPFLEAKISAKQKIMGLGHRVYKTKDPRAKILQNLAKGFFEKKEGDDLLPVAEELEKVSAELLGPRGIYPNVDFYSGLVYNKLGIPEDLFTCIFAAARTSGWLAHWLEQLEDNRIFRPTQIYIGEQQRAYVPITKR